MFRQIGMLALALLLFCACVHGEDVNDSGEPLAAITPEELAGMVAQLRLEAQIARTEIITVRMDTETQQLFDRLEDKMMAMEQKLAVIEDRFILLKNDLSDQIESSAAKTTADIAAKNAVQITEMNTEHKQFVRDMTNPIRINLPNFGLQIMVIAIFMLMAGLRTKKAVKDANREIDKIKKESNELKESGKDGRHS